MYRRILLAYDGSKEGRTALREGALLAKGFEAQVFLLSVVPQSTGIRVAEGAHAGVASAQMKSYDALFKEAMSRLKRLGFEPRGRLICGQPAQEIGHYAQDFRADLVVVGHRRQSLLERWWSGDNGAYLVDYVRCSVLIGRKVISDKEFEAAFHS